MSDANQIWVVVAVVLLAVLVGAAIPVLYQLQQTLRATRTMVKRLDVRANKTLEEVEQTTRRLNRFGQELEGQTEGIKQLIESITGLSGPINQLQGALTKAATISGVLIPAVAAAVGTYTAHRSQRDADDPGSGGSGPRPGRRSTGDGARDEPSDIRERISTA